MTFLLILLLTTAIAALTRPGRGVQTWARLGLGAAFVVAGLSHLVRPEPFEQHLPDWMPAEALIVVATGLIEIALGAALVWWSSRRRHVGHAVAAYLVAVLPANVYVAVADVDIDGVPSGVFAWLRVPLQAAFIAWALLSTRSMSSVRPGRGLGWPGDVRRSTTSGRAAR